MPTFQRLSHEESEPHLFEVVLCEGLAADALADELASELRALYADVEDLAARLRRQAEELGTVADEDRLDAVVNRVLKASIPDPGTHAIEHLDVARNELAELLAHLLLRIRYGALVPASRIRHKEIPGAPARGLDLLGLEFEPLRGVATEVKASEQESSPPGVVDSGADSLRGQFEIFLSDGDRMVAELNRLYKQASPEHLNAIADAIASHVDGKLDILVNPVLVRPMNRLADDDFGHFRQEPDQFDQCPVRFAIVCVNSSLADLAEVVYEKARAA